jgi:hypothetical protein
MFDKTSQARPRQVGQQEIGVSVTSPTRTHTAYLFICRPNCSAPELIQALMAVVGPSPDAHEAVKFRTLAARAADTINTRRSTIPGLVGDTSGLATGREVAAEWIWQQSTALLKTA